jgi:hypothetical protein
MPMSATFNDFSLHGQRQMGREYRVQDVIKRMDAIDKTMLRNILTWHQPVDLLGMNSFAIWEWTSFSKIVTEVWQQQDWCGGLETIPACRIIPYAQSPTWMLMTPGLCGSPPSWWFCALVLVVAFYERGTYGGWIERTDGGKFSPRR